MRVVCTGRQAGGQAGGQAGRQQGHRPGKVRRLVACIGTTVRGRLESRLHLHDDGFLGDFCLLLSDYKENSRNSNHYRLAAPGGQSYLSGVGSITTCCVGAQAGSACLCAPGETLAVGGIQFPHL